MLSIHSAECRNPILRVCASTSISISVQYLYIYICVYVYLCLCISVSMYIYIYLCIGGEAGVGVSGAWGGAVRGGAGQTKDTHELMCEDCDPLVLAPEVKRQRPSALSYAEHDPPTANVTLFSRRAWNMADLAVKNWVSARRFVCAPPLRPQPPRSVPERTAFRGVLLASTMRVLALWGSRTPWGTTAPNRQPLKVTPARPGGRARPSRPPKPTSAGVETSGTPTLVETGTR